MALTSSSSTAALPPNVFQAVGDLPNGTIESIEAGGNMDSNYVEFREGSYWVKGQGVSLDSIVYCFREGFSPETIVQDCFPALTLEQVYGAITYYLANQTTIDEYLKESERDWDAFRAEIEARYPESRQIREKLRSASTRRTS
jgi:uncharacterized protein (DUF433 family)